MRHRRPRAAPRSAAVLALQALADLGSVKGSVITRAWDPVTGQLTRLALDRQDISGTEVDLNYAYDLAGNVTSIADTPTNTAVQSQAERQCFSYDGMRRLTQAWSTTAGACQAAGSVSQSNIGGPSPFWQQYAYDSVGNRTQKIVRTSAGATTTVNTFGGVGSGPHRRVQSQTTSPSGAVVANGFSFDGAGNQTSTMVGADQKTLGWDAEGELVSVSGGSTAESSVYDASGNRLIRTDAAGSTVFLPGGMEVKVTPANVVSATRWYTFGGRTVAYRNASGNAAMVVVIPDHQGTPAGTVAQSNWAAGVTRTRTDPFGAARSTATGTNGRGFLAATVDTTGLVALGARYYDPVAGVFVSVDPVLDNRNTAQFNAYVYSGNNPISARERHPGSEVFAATVRVDDADEFSALVGVPVRPGYVVFVVEPTALRVLALRGLKVIGLFAVEGVVGVSAPSAG